MQSRLHRECTTGVSPAVEIASRPAVAPRSPAQPSFPPHLSCRRMNTKERRPSGSPCRGGAASTRATGERLPGHQRHLRRVRACAWAKGTMPDVRTRSGSGAWSPRWKHAARWVPTWSIAGHPLIRGPASDDWRRHTRCCSLAGVMAFGGCLGITAGPATRSATRMTGDPHRAGPGSGLHEAVEGKMRRGPAVRKEPTNRRDVDVSGVHRPRPQRVVAILTTRRVPDPRREIRGMKAQARVLLSRGPSDGHARGLKGGRSPRHGGDNRRISTEAPNAAGDGHRQAGVREPRAAAPLHTS